MTVHWADGARAETLHAFKNTVAGLPSMCGRGRFPQDATPPTTNGTVCRWCAAVTRPPNAETLGGSFEKGYPWAQHSDWHRTRNGVRHRTPGSRSQYGDS